MLFALSTFPDRVHEALEQACGAPVSTVDHHECVKAARMLLHYTASALEPQIAEAVQKLTDLMRDRTAASGHDDALLTMAQRLAHGAISPDSSANSKGTMWQCRGEKEAAALLRVANVCRSDSIKKAAAKLSEITQTLHLRALDTPFIPAGLMAMVDKNGDAIRKHWQQDFSPLAPYAAAHALMCVHPRFLHKTIILERVASMGAGPLADEGTRARMGTTDAMEQVGCRSTRPRTLTEPEP